MKAAYYHLVLCFFELDSNSSRKQLNGIFKYCSRQLAAAQRQVEESGGGRRVHPLTSLRHVVTRQESKKTGCSREIGSERDRKHMKNG